MYTVARKTCTTLSALSFAAPWHWARQQTHWSAITHGTLKVMSIMTNVHVSKNTIDHVAYTYKNEILY